MVDLTDFRMHRVSTAFRKPPHKNPFLAGSLQSLVAPADIKKRREYVSPFFGRAAIARAEATLHGVKLGHFLFTLAAAEGSVVNFFLAFRCLTADVIMQYCFRADVGALDSPGFENETVEKFVQGSRGVVVAKFFPRFFGVLMMVGSALPDKWRKKYFGGMYGFETMQKLARERVEDALNRADRGEDGCDTMFDAMARPDEGKGQVRPEMKDMVADGCLMIAAGTDTTAYALGTILWHVTQNPKIEVKLLEELKRRMGKEEMVVASARLESDEFKYLRAVVREGLRISFGIPGRIVRIVPKEGAKFRELWVPGGVGSSFFVSKVVT
jgi:cytochrome P450